MKTILAFVIAFALFGGGTTMAARPASDADLAAVRGLDTNGCWCDALSGSQCVPGKPADNGFPPFTTYSLCSVYQYYYVHDGYGHLSGTEDDACGKPPNSHAYVSLCYAQPIAPFPKHDRCVQTKVLTNNCALHGGYCSNLQVGMCIPGDYSINPRYGGGAGLSGGWMCICDPSPTTVPDDGIRWYCK
jgi:hypothetical protein